MRGWRLADLDRRGRVVAGVVVVLLALPFAVSTARALADGWVPSGDEAVIAVQVHDVFSHHPPLTGLPSTSDLYGDKIATNHPGPIEFYLLALPVKLLGPSAGMLVGAGAINLTAVLVAAWAVLRRAGPAVALWAATLLGITLWSTGLAVLTDPISSNMGGFPLLCGGVLVWALMLGDVRLLPAAAVALGYAAQQHLAVVGPAATLGLAGVVGLVLTSRGHGERQGSEGDGVGDQADAPPPLGRWLGITLGVAGLMWSPVLIDQLTGDPGNLGEILRFARDGGRATLGPVRGATQVLRAVGLPPFMARWDVSGFDVAAPLNPLGVAAGLAGVAALVALAVRHWTSAPALARLAVTGLVAAVAGFVAGSSVPRSIEADRINLYRWTWLLALCLWTAIGWSLAPMLRRRVPAVAVRARPAAVGVLVAAVVLSATWTGADDTRRDEGVFEVDAELSAAVERAVPSGPVLVVPDGLLASLSVVPAVIADLVDAGRVVEVVPEVANAYGDQRSFEPGGRPTVIVISSAYGPVGDKPGTEIVTTSIHPEEVARVDRLFAAVRRGPIVPAPDASDLLLRFPERERAILRVVMDGLGTDPATALKLPAAIDLLAAGYLTSPRFDPTDLARQRASVVVPTHLVWGEERLAVRRLTLDELRAARPHLFD